MSSENTSMSFLDVMACALGGMAMLFLILAIMPHQGAIAKQKDRTDQISTIPATPKPTQGKESKRKPVLYSIEHPNCDVDIQSVIPVMDDLKPKPVIWSQMDGLDNSRRRGFVRIFAGVNAKILFRNCKGTGEFVVVKIKDEYTKKNVYPLEKKGSQTVLHYINNVWEAKNV
jgi:hypothetical protein